MLNNPLILNVLHLGKFYPPYKGGIETHLKSLCEESIAFGVRPTVFVVNGENYFEESIVSGVNVIRFPRTLNIASAPFPSGLSPYIRRGNWDILHLHHPHPGAIFSFLRSGYKGKVVLTYHSDIVRQKFLSLVFNPFLIHVLKRCSKIIATSPEYANSSPILKRFREKTKMIPLGNPLDISLLNEDTSDVSNSAVEEFKSKFGGPLILCVGRLIYYKGFQYAIQAIRDTPAKLLIIGQGPLLEVLQDECKKAGVQDRVFFLGEVTNLTMGLAYQACDAFLLPSTERSEAFGLVQVEAMSFGKPVINTALDSGVPFVSIHNQTGLTVAPKSSEAIAEAINYLIQNPAICGKFGVAAKERATVEFSPSLMAERTCNMYRSCIEE